MSPDPQSTPPPAAGQNTPAPAAVSPPPAPPPATQSSGSPGSSGVTPQPGLTTPAAAVPPTAPGTPPTPPQAPPTFEAQFAQRYGMTPDQAQMLMTMGYQQYQARPGQPGPAPAAGAAGPTPAEAPKNPFGLQPFDLNLLNFVAKGPDGGLVGLPGAPPDAVFRVQQYQDQLRQVQTQFWQDPLKFLGPMIAEQAKKVAAETYQQQFGGYQQQTETQNILAQNADWLFAKDAAGQRQQQFNPATGRMAPVLSPYGQFYSQKVAEYARSGVQDVKLQHDLAVQALTVALYTQQRQAAGAGAQGAAAGQQFLQQQAPGAVPPPPATVPLPPPPPGQSLRDRLRAQFESNGLNDATVNGQIARAG